MGCSHRKEHWAFDWEKIDQKYERKRPKLRRPERTRIKNVFELLNFRSIGDELMLNTFFRLLHEHPDVIKYFRGVSSTDAQTTLQRVGSESSVISKDIHYPPVVKAVLKGNTCFIGHIKETQRFMQQLVRCLSDQEAFDDICRTVELEHVNLPAMNRVFFQDMFSVIDTSILQGLGSVNYTGAERRAVRKFLIVIYVALCRRMETGDIDWLAIDSCRARRDTFSLRSEGSCKSLARRYLELDAYSDTRASPQSTNL